MMQFAAELVFAQGEVFVHDGRGSDRRAHSGDALKEGETLVTHSGAQAELSLADGRTIVIGSDEAVYLDASVASPDKPDVEDAAFFASAADLNKVFQSLGGELESMTQGLGEWADSSSAHHGFAYLSQMIEVLAPQALSDTDRMDSDIIDVGNGLAEGGVDVFSWTLNEPATRTSVDVSLSQQKELTGETLNLRDLLVDDWNSGGTLENLSDYLHFEQDGGDTVIHISSTGAFKGGYDSLQADQTIILKDVDMMHAPATDNEMIRALMEQGRLITD